VTSPFFVKRQWKGGVVTRISELGIWYLEI